MVGRRTPQDEAHNLAIRTDFKGKGVAHDDGRGATLVGGGSNGAVAGARAPPNDRFTTRSPTASLSSISTLGDEQVNTHLSASSAGNTDTLSSSGISGRSTARTSTMTDDGPSASSPTSPSPHAHPALTVLQLVSNSASSSALPDSFDFNVSRKGNYVAVYSASNIWLIKTAQLPRLWARTLQVKRKPIAIDITEDGFLLAVLSRPTQVDLYEIHGDQDEQIKKRRSIGLVHEATTTVISPDARILITGNKFGIEVIAIGPEAPETARRALSGPVGDSLEFAEDGRTLLITGYARKSESSSLYVLPGLYDGPMDEEGVPIPVAPETIWTTSVLFPETARIARQATLLPDADTGHVSELFAFNSEEDTWGIYDIACQRFTQRKMFLPDHQRWTRSEYVDDAMPAVSPNADLAAVALRVRGTTSIWIYEVPGWECKPSEKQSLIQPCFCIPILKDGADVSQEISALRWVRINSKVQRLVAVGNSTLPQDDNADPGAPVGSKGVIIVLDFDKSKPTGSPVPAPTKTEYDLDPLCPGEILPEGSISFESEVELVRTRTIAQRRIQDRAAGARRNSRIGSQPARSRTTTTTTTRNPPRPAPPPVPVHADDEEELTFEEAQAAFEAPYDNQQPRSQMSLARAATVAAVSPANRRHLRALPFRPLEYRRADGLREFPHESDADNWVPPPPVYTATAEASQSISLSHPNAPPVPRKPSNATRSISASHATPPLTSATVSPTQLVAANPYLARGQSVSSTDLTLPPPSQERRPSLLHPSTYPSPQSPPTTRRRSSTAHGPPQHVPTVPPNTQIQNQSAYQATQTLMSTARRPLRPRRAVESTVDLRPPPVVDPATLRRGSEPDVMIHGHGRSQSAQSPNVGANRMRLANGFSPSGHAQRNLLPRLSTHGDAAARRGPMTAPPISDNMSRAQPRVQSRAESRLGMGSRMGMRSGVREPHERDHGRKSMKCIVM